VGRWRPHNRDGKNAVAAEVSNEKPARELGMEAAKLTKEI